LSDGAARWRLTPDYFPDVASHTHIAIADLTGDGVLDEVFLDFSSGETQANPVQLRTAGGPLSSPACGALRGSPMGFDMGDVNADGRLDYYMSDIGGQQLCVAAEQTWFSSAAALGASVPSSPVGGDSITWASRILDLDADRDMDLLATGGWEHTTDRRTQALVAVRNDGPSFSPWAGGALTEPVAERAMAVGDLNGDGCPDLVLGPVQGGKPLETSGPRVVINGLCEDRPMQFIPAIDVDGAPAPGIEALVTYDDGTAIRHRATGSGGYAGAGPVGVWMATAGVTTVEVRLQDGRVQTVSGVPDVLAAW
jgi:hypothetical protein